jgi:indolepyruvate ferredoxin oxidoreductase, beta subunit
MQPGTRAIEPIKVLIAALGGEGGGVLATWLHTAAIAEGHFVQGTSIPGVAQRTGATTYYMEIVPGAVSRHARNDAPVLSLNAAPGEVDLFVASELLEAVRAISAGFVTPDRTVLVASTARVYTVDEKSAMGDGRIDPARLEEVGVKFSRVGLLRPFHTEAARLGCPISPVLLGAIAAAGGLPISPDAFRDAIRTAGKAVDGNLRGFEAGLRLARGARLDEAEGRATDEPVTEAMSPGLAHLSPAVHGVVAYGHARLCDYQDRVYADSYLQVLERFARMPAADASFMQELARQLALRMSVEDVIRVAQLKLRAARLDRVRREAQAGGGDIIDITEYLKPGPEEICGLLPPRLGTWLLARLPKDKAWAMTVRTTRLSGFLRLKALAGLRRWRPSSLRFARELQWRTEWLDLLQRALAVDVRAAQEIAALASLVRGYGATYERGWHNCARIVDELVEPMLAGRLPSHLFADAVLQARLAASKDPEGAALSAVLDALHKATAQQRTAAE